MNIIMANWDSVLVVLLFIIAVLYFWRKGEKKKISGVLLSLVTKAEHKFGGGTGDLKFAQVTEWIYGELPTIVRFLFTKQQIDDLIEDAVEEMKKVLEKNMKARVLIIDAPTLNKEILQERY